MLNGHEDGVVCLNLVGDIVASGSGDRTVRVWNVITGQCLHIFTTSTVWHLRISPHSDFLVNTSTHLPGVEVWDLERGELAHTARYYAARECDLETQTVPDWQHMDDTMTMHLCGNLVLCGTDSGTVAVIDYSPRDEQFNNTMS